MTERTITISVTFQKHDKTQTPYEAAVDGPISRTPFEMRAVPNLAPNRVRPNLS